jgi:hypothetical protein
MLFYFLISFQQFAFFEFDFNAAIISSGRAMRYHYNCCTLFLINRFQDIQNFIGKAGIKITRRFISKQ